MSGELISLAVPFAAADCAQAERGVCDVSIETVSGTATTTGIPAPSFSLRRKYPAAPTVTTTSTPRTLTEHGVVPVEVGESRGLVDVTESWVSRPQFANAPSFSEGLATVHAGVPGRPLSGALSTPSASGSSRRSTSMPSPFSMDWLMSGR